jgi:hypothetical protein
MAKFDLRFIDCFNDGDYIKTEVQELQSKDVIEIYGKNGNDFFGIILDKSTAIKFAKTLRTEINKITESEVLNG